DTQGRRVAATERAEIDHAATEVDEGMLRATIDGRLANDVAAVVDGVGVAEHTTQGADLLHALGGVPQEGTHVAFARVGETDDLVQVVDVAPETVERAAAAAIFRQASQVDGLHAVEQEGVRGRAGERPTGNETGVVDAARR